MKNWCKEFRTSRWSFRGNGNKSHLYLNPEKDKWNLWHTYWGKKATNTTSWNQMSQKEAAISYLRRFFIWRAEQGLGMIVKRESLLRATKQMMLWRIKIDLENNRHSRSVNLYKNYPLKMNFHVFVLRVLRSHWWKSFLIVWTLIKSACVPLVLFPGCNRDFGMWITIDDKNTC